MELGQSPIFGSHTGTPSGTRSDGSWWSVTMTSMPSATSCATSALHEMPQSTVTMTSGAKPLTRSMAGGVRA